MAIQIIIALLLLFGTVFVITLSIDLWNNKALLRDSAGSFPLLCLGETVIFLIASFGVSDFVLNTAILRTSHVVEDKDLPGTLACAAAVPSVGLAIFYISTLSVELPTLLSFLLPFLAGILIGVRTVTRLSGEVIRVLMGWAMAASAVVLVARMLLSRSGSGTLTSLPVPALLLVGVVAFLLGVFNTLGFGSKAPAMTLLLSLGLSPACLLAIIMTAAGFGAPLGGRQYVKAGRYQRKAVLAGALFGLVGVVIGGQFVSGMSPVVLQWIMVAIMLYTSVTMLWKKRVKTV